MLIKLYFLDKISIKPRYIQTDYINYPELYQPNGIIYFCGLLIALLIQILVFADYFLNYYSMVDYLIQSRWKDMRYLINKFALGPIQAKDIAEYYWVVTFTFFFFEIIYCTIAYNFLNKSLLYISIVIWSISIVESIFTITVVRVYMKSTEDLRVMAELRARKIHYLELDITRSTVWWRAEEMLKHGTNYDESILESRITEYRNKHIRVINELVHIKDSFIVEVMETIDEFRFSGTVLEGMQQPTHYNVINFVLFFGYTYKCSNDSQFIYDLFYNFRFIKQQKNYTPSFKFFEYNSLLNTLDPEILNIFLNGCNYTNNF